MHLKSTLILLPNLLLANNQFTFKSQLDLSFLSADVSQLIDSSKNSNLVWDRLAEMTDLFGHRLPGSAGFKNSLQWIKEKAIKEDKLDAYIQPVNADVWTRNEESLYFISPTRGRVKLDFLGLGKSVGTDIHGITGEVVSIRDWDEHKLLGKQGKLKGKIVLCNPFWTGYRQGSDFRKNCAIRSEPYGAIAVLVRSATAFSLSSPHTGMMSESKIPGAAITLEDAEMFHRIQERAKKVIVTPEERYMFKPPVVHLTMGATMQRNQPIPGNLIVELKGSEKPDEIVIMSGHIDSWDVGAGVQDDGASAFVAWEALRQISKLNKRPKRTLRAIFWADEEQGGSGAKTYLNSQINNLNNHVLAMESDSGIYEPKGFYFSGTDEAYEIFSQIGKQLLSNTTYGNVIRINGGDADISYMCNKGVPCASLSSAATEAQKQRTYFNFHHTKADRMESLNPNEVGKCTAMTAGFIYSVAQLPVPLPKKIVN